MDVAFSVDLPRRAEGYTLFGWEDGVTPVSHTDELLAASRKAGDRSSTARRLAVGTLLETASGPWKTGRL